MRYSHTLYFLLLLLLTTMVSGQDSDDWASLKIVGFEDITYSHPALIDYNPGSLNPDPDGIFDVVSGANDGTLRYQLNLSTNNTFFLLDSTESAVFSNSYVRSATHAVDYNADGLTDLLVGDRSGEINLYLNNGPNFSFNSTLVEDVSVSGHSKPVAVDLNQDDVLDLVVGQESGSLVAFINSGSWDSPSFERNDDIFRGYSVGNHPTPYPIDPDDDGVFSFIVGSESSGISILQASGGENGFADYDLIAFRTNSNPFQQISKLNEESFITPSMADLDEDGYLDLIFGTQSGEIYIYQNPGIDLAEINPGINPVLILLIGTVILIIAIFVTMYLVRMRYQQRGIPLYLMLIQDIGISPYKFAFSEDAENLIDDITLAGGALTGIQALINEITSTNLNSIEAGDNRILVVSHPFNELSGYVQVLLWSTADDPKLRSLAAELANYVATTLESNFRRSAFDETFDSVVDSKIAELFSNYL